MIGASAGGVEALTTVARGLPADLPGAVFVVLHLPGSGTSLLADILDRAGPLPARRATQGAPVTPGSITVAPADHHLVLERERVRLVRGPKVDGHRPAVDVLFRSAAAAFGRRVLGVVLSGSLRDGTLGLGAVKRGRGRAIVQGDAIHQGMPTSAMENVEVDAVVPLHEIASRLTMFVIGEQEATVNEPVDEPELDAIRSILLSSGGGETAQDSTLEGTGEAA